MTKSRAYTTEFGFEKVTAWSIMQERKKYGGHSLRRTYWSTHAPGKRKPVKHVQNKSGTTFFAYLNGADEIDGDGGGAPGDQVHAVGHAVDMDAHRDARYARTGCILLSRRGHAAGRAGDGGGAEMTGGTGMAGGAV